MLLFLNGNSTHRATVAPSAAFGRHPPSVGRPSKEGIPFSLISLMQKAAHELLASGFY
ncbi:MAG: hypothetical protein QMB24_02315 [Spirosomataceae bacterium]